MCGCSRAILFSAIPRMMAGAMAGRMKHVRLLHVARLSSAAQVMRQASCIAAISHPLVFAPARASPLQLSRRRRVSTEASSREAASRWIKKVAAACEAAKPDTMGRIRQLDSGATDALFDPFLTDDEVFILDIGPQGQYSLQCDGDRLRLDSALSGSRIYTYHAESDTWRDPADGPPLGELLARELQEVASVVVRL